MTLQNKQVLLASRPQGSATEENFRIVEAPLATPAAGEVLVKNERPSLDPYMRGRMSEDKSYVPPAPLGVKRAPASYYLGVLGMPGIPACFGLSEIGQPKAGETVLVSAASGAVGSVVGQLAKIKGCRAVGIAGGRKKCDYVVQELGFDACVDYKAGNLLDDLRQACPKGVDVDFENVGGEILDTSLRLMNRFSRIVVCGLIAEYSEPYRYKALRSVLVNRIKMQGMIVFDWKDRYSEALEALVRYHAEGKLKYRESVVHGIENAPKGLIALLKGENFGKQLVKLD